MAVHSETSFSDHQSLAKEKPGLDGAQLPRSKHNAGHDGGLYRSTSASTGKLYEWEPVKPLDALYHDVLQYFYYKGQLEGMFKNQPRLDAIRDHHANLLLKPALTAFLKTAQASQVALPFASV